MLKQKRHLFEFLFLAADLFVISVAWLFSYLLRFKSGLVEVQKGTPPFSRYLVMVLFIWLIWAFVFKRMGLYRPMRGVRRSTEIWRLVNANALALLLFMSVTYLFWEKQTEFSRLVFVYFGALATIFTVMQRILLRFLLQELRRRGHNLRYMLIIGAGKVASDIISRIRLRRELGIQLLGCLSKDGTEKRGPGGVSVMGSYADLGEILRSWDIDQVVVALPFEDNQILPDIMDELKDSTVDVKIVPDVYQFISVGGSIEEFEGLPIISVQESPIEGVNLLAKRLLDVAIAGTALVAFAPLMLVISVLLKLTSSGPVLYAQERMSIDGSRFRIYKFRTMRSDAEAEGPQWSKRGDKRITLLGRVLRAYSLDELPQLINVIRGDMSLVGPRPERPVFINEFRKQIPKYMLRHKVPAGMTGWAQINGWRGDTSIDKRIECDLFYIKNWSILFDLKIVLLTLFKGLRNRNAC